MQITEEKRTNIHQTILKERNVNRVTTVNFSINIGTRVPRSVRLAVLPASVITIVPEYRSYRYFVVGDQICIVEPRSYEIVEVIRVSDRTARSGCPNGATYLSGAHASEGLGRSPIGFLHENSMKLYVTSTSPYARIVRAVVLEKGLTDSVEIVVTVTRKVDSPYYAINPSGRVPYLVRDDGIGMEDSQLYRGLSRHARRKAVDYTPFALENWAYGRLEAYARSMIDGICVWVREMRRPESERSPTMQLTKRSAQDGSRTSGRTRSAPL